jgi:ethanolamine utilization protein EutA
MLSGLSQHLAEDEQKVFNSVGIDVGSTTTQLVFSELTLGFVEEKHKFDVIKRKITYFSRIYLTPFKDNKIVDIDELSKIISEAYKDSGYDPTSIDTGAIIITGVAALRKNAENIVDLFSNQVGKFVCATAGPNYEAILAAHGSGTVELSERRLKTVMNVDVGGGTTKIAIVKNGEIIDTASLYVGARHLVLNEDNQILRVEDPAELIAEHENFNFKIGEEISHCEAERFTSILVDSLFQVIKREEPSILTEKLMATPPLRYKGKIDYILFSGGVSEYIYGYESKVFGDLGLLLSAKINEYIKKLQIPVVEPDQRIRATVIGESQYTVQISGSTNIISDFNLLPLRNLPVLAPKFSSEILTQNEIEEELKKLLDLQDLSIDNDSFAIAFARNVINQPSYKLMKKLSNAIYSFLEDKVKTGGIIVLVFEADIGMGMGRVIKEEIAPNCKLISIDEIKLSDFNYIDVGEPQGSRNLIPVIVKSLVFPKFSFRE